MKSKKQRRCTKKELCIGLKNREYGRKKELEDALQVLINHDYISEPQLDESTKKPTTFYVLHPNFNEYVK
jgi:hypothetical protein